MKNDSAHVEQEQNAETTLDREAMSTMEDEGGGTRRPEAKHEEEQPINEALQHRDRSPVIAMFRSATAANQALKALRGMGIANENIAVASSDAVVHSPANDAGTYRATGEAENGSEFKEPTLRDSFRPAIATMVHASPDSKGYDERFDARQYLRPKHQVMVSVEVTPESRQRVRELLIDLGAAS